MAQRFEPLPQSAARQIASYAIAPEKPEPKHLAIEIGQAEHRINLINAWQIPPSSRVLEIGCGQGTCTAVLAEAVGPHGHVDAVDPAPGDYGGPFTLAQAQAHLSAGPFGDRISWHRATLHEILTQRPEETWDFAVLAHCIWYMDGPQTLTKALSALRGRVANLVVAEYALTASEKAAMPHLLATVAVGGLEAHDKDSTANIRCSLAPAQIRASAEAAGWVVETERVVVPGSELLDGFWEVGGVKSKSFATRVDSIVHNDTFKATLLSLREAVMAAVASLGEERVRTMDVWVCRFAPAAPAEL